jgi:undecaprenyl pyrophosphate synthase
MGLLERLHLKKGQAEREPEELALRQSVEEAWQRHKQETDSVSKLPFEEIREYYKKQREQRKLSSRVKTLFTSKGNQPKEDKTEIQQQVVQGEQQKGYTPLKRYLERRKQNRSSRPL